MELNVELIYDSNCPNVTDARTHLLRAFTRVGIAPNWQEWERGNSETPAHVRAFGSPTILVDGKDVADASPSIEGNCCRLYLNESRQLKGVPSVEVISSALLRGKNQSLRGGHNDWERRENYEH